MATVRISQRRKQNVNASPSSSLVSPIRPFAPSPLSSKDLPTSSAQPKGFSYSFERMTVHRSEPDVIAENNTEPIVTAETTNPSLLRPASNTEALAEQEMPTALGVASPVPSSASALQRQSVSANNPVPPLSPINRQANHKHSGWSLDRIAITRDHLSPVQRQALNVSQTSEPVSQAEVLQQQPVEPATARENTTGLPNHLKAGVENLSGLSLDDVRVHYHSAKPAQVDALAYTQGTEIHVGSGQEQHLPHEVWHVVQQKQGRVQSTLQKQGIAINDDQVLEREADVMGAKGLSQAEKQPETVLQTQSLDRSGARNAQSSSRLQGVTDAYANMATMYPPIIQRTEQITDTTSLAERHLAFIKDLVEDMDNELGAMLRGIVGGGAFSSKRDENGEIKTELSINDIDQLQARVEHFYNVAQQLSELGDETKNVSLYRSLAIGNPADLYKSLQPEISDYLPSSASFDKELAITWADSPNSIILEIQAPQTYPMIMLSYPAEPPPGSAPPRNQTQKEVTLGPSTYTVEGIRIEAEKRFVRVSITQIPLEAVSTYLTMAKDKNPAILAEKPEQRMLEKDEFEALFSGFKPEDCGEGQIIQDKNGQKWKVIGAYDDMFENIPLEAVVSPKGPDSAGPSTEGQTQPGTSLPEPSTEGQTQPGTSLPEPSTEGQTQLGTSLLEPSTEGQTQLGTSRSGKKLWRKIRLKFSKFWRKTIPKIIRGKRGGNSGV